MALGLGDIPFGQEIVFLTSMVVVCYMLILVTEELEHETRLGILFATIIVFAFRATPSVGDGFFWWTLDELNFNAAFYGTLRQTGAILSIAVLWAFSKQLTESSVTKTLSLDRDRGNDAFPSQYWARLWFASLDRGDIWIWCAHHRLYRLCGGVALRPN